MGYLDFDIEQYKDLYPFEQKTFQVGLHKINYFDEGEGDVILMVHGNPTWSFYYRNLALALKDRYRVVAIDHLGCGLSDKPQKYEYTLKNHITNLEALIEELDLKNINLVVHDWGGMIGFGAAVDQVENFKSFLILNTCAFRLPRVNNFPVSIAACRVPVFGRIATRVFNGFSRGASLMASVSDEFTRREKEGLMAPYNSYQNRVAIHQFVQDIPLDPSHRSYDTLMHIERNLQNLKDHPKQVIWGMKDFCFDKYFLKEWRNFFPDIDVLELPDAGHYVLEDSREKVISTASAFFDRVNGKGDE